MDDPRQIAYAAHRAAYREQWRRLNATDPYQHPDGSPKTPFAENPLLAVERLRDDGPAEVLTVFEL